MRACHYRNKMVKEVAEQTRRFFKRIRTLPGKSANIARKNQDLFWTMFTGQFERLTDLAAAFNDFDEDSAKAYSTFQNYLVVTNKFFADSGKVLAFNEKSNRLEFSYVNESAEQSKEFKHISHLSSGERQILILFTFLAFSDDQRRVFIVDEPELSLHPKWQEEFLSAFLSLKGPETQLLIATHSPEIVGKYKDACVVLVP